MKERLTARVVLLNLSKEILLLKIKSANTTSGFCWLIPGGRIEEGETPLQAAQRELFEETGITNANIVTPHAWYAEDILNVYGEQIFFKEHIFLAYTQEKTVRTMHNPDENERNDLLEVAWWDFSLFKKSGEILFPRGLSEALEPIFFQNYIPAITTRCIKQPQI